MIPRFKLNLFLLFLIGMISIGYAQIDADSAMGLPTTTTLTDVTSQTGFTQGQLVYVADENQVYLYDGTQWVSLLSSNSRDRVDNELFFENSNYYYVSVTINTTEWMVTRYDRSDINVEASASGTGAQPSDLATVTGLTY